MKPTSFVVAAAVGLLTGCPSVWPKGRFSAEHDLGEPSRVHTWSFANMEPGRELELVRRELQRQLAAAGWFETPAGQAELLVEPSLSVGEPEWVDGTPGFLVAAEAAVTVLAIVGGGEMPELYEPEYVPAWPKDLRIRILRSADGWVVYEGYAAALDEASRPTTLAGALTRALLVSFPGPRRRSWSTELPPYPSSRVTAERTTPQPAPGLPPRAVCVDAVPVVAYRKARFRDQPDPSREVVFRLEEVTSGCATHAANGLVDVALTDGRSGYLAITSVRYHPGP